MLTVDSSPITQLTSTTTMNFSWNLAEAKCSSILRNMCTNFWKKSRTVLEMGALLHLVASVYVLMGRAVEAVKTSRRASVSTGLGSSDKVIVALMLIVMVLFACMRESSR